MVGSENIVYNTTQSAMAIRPWMTLNGDCALCFKKYVLGAHHETLNEDRPISAIKM